MGIYLNPGNIGFRTVRRTTYVDKTGLIAEINRRIGSMEKLVCISRPRRFGKSFAAKMLCAYYDHSCDSAELFDDLDIARDASYREHLNQYDVIYLDITSFMSGILQEEILQTITKDVQKDIQKAYPDVAVEDTLANTLVNVVESTGRQFVMIIDEWDALIRDSDISAALQKDYLQFLRQLFKNSQTTDKVFAAAYMTGILPIRKDGTQSAVSEFREYNMLAPKKFQSYVGFTEDEVKVLCRENAVDFSMMKKWYDGYSFDVEKSVYNPNSVMRALEESKFKSYWQMSSATDSLVSWINMDYHSLGTVTPKLLAGIDIPVNVRKFQNDLRSFRSADDVLTLLIHFGYLNYDAETETVRIPNEEIRDEFADMVRDVTHTETIRRVQESDRLIADTIAGDESAVAEQLEKIHREECAPILYNNEQALRSVVKLAYFAYRDYYMKMEEIPSGTGIADIVYLPRPAIGVPALVIELKWNETAEGAIAQIKNRHYPDILKNYASEILLIGISYDKNDKEKKHSCRIESWSVEHE